MDLWIRPEKERRRRKKGDYKEKGENDLPLATHCSPSVGVTFGAL